MVTRKRKNSGEPKPKATQMVKVKDEVEEVEVIKPTTDQIVSVVVANCKAVNVREKPSKDAKVLLVAKVGTPFYVLEEGRSWSLVDSEILKHPGYVMNSFLKLVE